MSHQRSLPFSVRYPRVLLRIAELFEEEADRTENATEALFWLDMGLVCRHQAEGRQINGRAIRPVLEEIRWDVIERVVEGEAPYPRLSPEEAREAARLLTEQKASARDIADRVEVVPRTVNRWRREDRKNNK